MFYFTCAGSLCDFVVDIFTHFSLHSKVAVGHVRPKLVIWCHVMLRWKCWLRIMQDVYTLYLYDAINFYALSLQIIL